MIARKKPTPPSFVAASKPEKGERARTGAGEARPAHRARDDRSLIPPGEALRIAAEKRKAAKHDETTEAPSGQRKTGRAIRPVLRPQAELEQVAEPVRKQVSQHEGAQPYLQPRGSRRTVKRRESRDELRAAILADSPEADDYTPQEVQNPDQPLPQLVASDFEDDAIPDFFVERPNPWDSDELLLPPARVESGSYGMAGEMIDERVYDVELSDLFEPQDEALHESVPFRETVTAEAVTVSREDNDDLLEGSVVLNEAWRKASFILAGIPVGLISVVAILLTMVREESWVVPAIVVGISASLAGLWAWWRIRRFGCVTVDLSEGVWQVQSQSVPLSEVTTGEIVVSERFGILKQHVIALEVGSHKVEVLVMSGGWSIPVSEGDALVQATHLSGLPIRLKASSDAAAVGVRAASQSEVLSLVAATRMGLE